MTVVFEELQDLRGVWSELSRIWAQIDEIREKPWLSIQPRKLRQQLDTLTSQLKELPARLRQYSSYEYVKRLLQGYSKVSGGDIARISFDEFISHRRIMSSG